MSIGDATELVILPWWQEMGCLMKENIATEELFVIKMDGRIKSEHRQFRDALRAGLALRDQFPGHEVRLRAQPSIVHDDATQ